MSYAAMESYPGDPGASRPLGRLTPSGSLRPDPLVRPRTEGAKATAIIGATLLGAAVLHVAFTLVISAMGVILKPTRADKPTRSERIEIAIVQPRPAPQATAAVPPTVVEPEATAPLLPPKVQPRQARQKVARREPPPDPINRTQAPPAPPTAPQPRRVVGLNLESTVQGGTGPAYSVGNTRMGRTETRATDPHRIHQLRPEAPPPPPPPPSPSPNRAARHVPREGVKLVKPHRTDRRKPAYPATLRAQGIEADVVVRVTLDQHGTVTAVELVTPAPQPAFNAAARAAALQERFAPATRNGTAIAYSLSFTYRFRLND